ncbi:cytochrome c-type biogenesis protein CcmF [Rhodoligotrophos appendicifer]|uniref:heme lyase CcmF/NrfE family subunit n=1 Tax=Rhodoligotrophos appendicifer TaxID=987056 RepID=UPI0011859AC3|nr:heme lyase CcmF/NrfE family subunit [Rhodoligotrophos appendicifer]
MIIEAGHFALVLATVMALYQALVPLYGAQRGNARMMGVAGTAALAQFVFIATAFLALTYAFVVSDFSVRLVWANSHSAKPLLYKISGVWANHEGSMVLWVLILSLFGALIALFGRNLPLPLKARTLSVQGMIGLAFLLFILLTSNPFERLMPPPVDGNGINPLLQDPALAFHPPFLYAGYVGLSIVFSFAAAALIGGQVDAAWARWVRPWTLAAWMFLTVGIAMGSWWAYYELGWGGWWFWDPVENASLMPWLVATALLHSAVVVEKRNALKVWTILLAVLAFSLSLLGTFLVRSGVLTSVHAFAVDPERGVFILLILCLFIGGALSLFAWRAPQLKQGGLFAPVSRESALVVNNLLLAAAAAAVLTGTLYPLALEVLTGAKISVGPPFFNLTFGPLMLPLLLLVPIGPMLAWKRADAWAAVQRLWAAALIALLGGGIAFALKSEGPMLAPLGIALGLWLIAGAFAELAFRTKLGQDRPAASLRRLVGLPRSTFGSVLGHAGVGVMVLGIVGVTAWRQEQVLVMAPGQVVNMAGATVTFEGAVPVSGPNWRDEQGRFKVESGGRVVSLLTPSKRTFQPSGQTTSEVGIHPFWSGDLYLAMGDSQADAPAGARVVRLYFNPLVPLVWIGAGIMFLGGAISLTDRRFRIGAPMPAKAKPGRSLQQA